MNIFLTSILLGIIEGLTEFIPVSSTGHLILFGSLIGADSKADHTFSIFIQLGAILAVCLVLRNRIFDSLNFSTNPANDFKGFNACKLLAIACIPAFIVGPLLDDAIDELLFYPRPVAVALILGGVILWWSDSRNKSRQHAGKLHARKLKEITAKDALIIGCLQTLALWPGMSRSGMTILGGLLVGLSRHAAAEFSFLVALPVMTGAVAFKLIKNAALIPFDQLPILAVGFITAFISGAIAVKFFLRVVSIWSFRPFAIYRILIGLLVLCLVPQ